MELLAMRDVQNTLEMLPKAALVEALCDIAAALSFNEDGIYDPEESVAGGSGADFVESVQFTLDKIGLAL